METKSIRERVRRYAPLILWMALISIASTNEFSSLNTSRVVRPLLLWLFPGINEGRIHLVHLLVRKAAHFAEYAVLGFLAGRAFWASSHDLLRRFWFRAGFLLVICHALFDEYHQSFVPSRSGSLFDCFIDITGGAVALIGFAYFQKRRVTRPQLDR